MKTEDIKISPAQKDALFLYGKCSELCAQLSLRSNRVLDALIILINDEAEVDSEEYRFALFALTQICAYYKEKK
jgi:hypothetical protein